MALILKLISFVFSYSVQLKLALPQAAQLSINFLIIRKKWCCNSSRDLKEKKAHGRNRTHNLFFRVRSTAVLRLISYLNWVWRQRTAS